MKSQIANQKSQIPRGFTLIELLVVIAIVAISEPMSTFASIVHDTFQSFSTHLARDVP